MPDQTVTDRLAAAHARLMAAGGKVTVRALKAAAGVSTDTAAAWLRNAEPVPDVPPLPDLRQAIQIVWAAAWTAAHTEARRYAEDEVLGARARESEALERAETADQATAAAEQTRQSAEAAHAAAETRANEAETALTKLRDDFDAAARACQTAETARTPRRSRSRLPPQPPQRPQRRPPQLATSLNDDAPNQISRVLESVLGPPRSCRSRCASSFCAMRDAARAIQRNGTLQDRQTIATIENFRYPAVSARAAGFWLGLVVFRAFSCRLAFARTASVAGLAWSSRRRPGPEWLPRMRPSGAAPLPGL